MRKVCRARRRRMGYRAREGARRQGRPGDRVVPPRRSSSMQINARGTRTRSICRARSCRATLQRDASISNEALQRRDDGRVRRARATARARSRALAAQVLPTDVPIVSATKGIENESLMFIDEILAEELPQRARDHLAFLSGPSFAKELAHGAADRRRHRRARASACATTSCGASTRRTCAPTRATTSPASSAAAR